MYKRGVVKDSSASLFLVAIVSAALLTTRRSKNEELQRCRNTFPVVYGYLASHTEKIYFSTIFSLFTNAILTNESSLAMLFLANAQ